MSATNTAAAYNRIGSVLAGVGNCINNKLAVDPNYVSTPGLQEKFNGSVVSYVALLGGEVAQSAYQQAVQRVQDAVAAWFTADNIPCSAADITEPLNGDLPNMPPGPGDPIKF